MENQDLGKTNTGIQTNVAGSLCYALGWVTGLIFFLIEKDNKFVRFHALQSMIVFGSLNILSIVLSTMSLMMWGLGAFAAFVSSSLGFLWLILLIILVIKAYQGEKFKLSIAGDIAEKNSK